MPGSDIGNHVSMGILEAGKFVNIRTKSHASHKSNDFSIYFYDLHRQFNQLVNFLCKSCSKSVRNLSAGALEIFFIPTNTSL